MGSGSTKILSPDEAVKRCMSGGESFEMDFCFVIQFLKSIWIAWKAPFEISPVEVMNSVFQHSNEMSSPISYLTNWRVYVFKYKLDFSLTLSVFSVSFKFSIAHLDQA